jgi:alkanesulfonate monooxygenase SsuD/methylene tetrahydromethanopterin reductase-like flavin-dependent oxidoreductase (luciferase family)
MSGRRLKIGLVLPLLEAPMSGDVRRWASIRTMVLRAEEVGFDTVWIPDELLWHPPAWPGPRGFWECVAIAGAVAASTSMIGVGTWVLSALHRNPGLTAKAAETLSEISGGRFVLGLGAGHAGSQGAAFGYPPDHTIGRYEEALAVLVPALHGESVTFKGDFHRAQGLEIRPRGPRPIPLMLAGHGPRTMRLAARYADVWSGYATETSDPVAFTPMLAALDEACDQVGRDPATLGRSLGVDVEPTDVHVSEAAGMGTPLSGPPDRIAEALARFAELGATSVEVMLSPPTQQALDALTLAVDALGDR